MQVGDFICGFKKVASPKSFGPFQTRKEHQKIPLVNKKWLSILLGDRVPMPLGTMLLEMFLIASSFEQLNRETFNQRFTVILAKG